MKNYFRVDSVTIICNNLQIIENTYIVGNSKIHRTTCKKSPQIVEKST